MKVWTLCLVLASQVALADTEEPFSGDFTWLNGSNRQPSSLLKVKPISLSVYVDTYFLIQFHNPVDHTAFPSTVAPRHNEASLNLASIGALLPPNAIDTPAGGPIAELDLQYGAQTQTIAAQDTTTQRGFFLASPAFAPIRVATAGWHFHWMQGANLEVGIFPSYFGLESYLTQENWNYLRTFMSDFTPYYFSGARVQVYPTKKTKIELWAINGWQTFGQWHEAGGAGYLLAFRPSERVALSTAGYVGSENPSDESIVRFYTDHDAQVQLFKRSSGALRSIALCGAFDLGYETAGRATPGSGRAGAFVAGRFEWARGIATTLRSQTYFDEGQVLVPPFPIGSPYVRPDMNKAFVGSGLAATIDYLPSPWLVVRLEYEHRGANIPLFSGRGGITGPNGAPAASPASFTPDLRRFDDRAVLALILRL